MSHNCSKCGSHNTHKFNYEHFRVDYLDTSIDFHGIQGHQCLDCRNLDLSPACQAKVDQVDIAIRAGL
ncbi:hypothetical protein HNP46_000039 [Pseudomonas nitritireducens]|uniref:Uncharacterized protein n=1 Tax=Pseudomonas nitroreducens TaxID=46680 RepID=A0A7W7KFP0_PSENT|nr:hypothetical protein [Pseudomonas nitritireducens]